MSVVKSVVNKDQDDSERRNVPVEQEDRVPVQAEEDEDQTWIEGVDAEGKRVRVKSEDYAKWEARQARKSR